MTTSRPMTWRLRWASALSAQKHCNAPVVTASVDNISFENPIKLGNVVHIEANVTRAFNTSMEVHMNVWGEDLKQQVKYKSNEAYYTFVALNANGKPSPVPQLILDQIMDAIEQSKDYMMKGKHQWITKE